MHLIHITRRQLRSDATWRAPRRASHANRHKTSRTAHKVHTTSKSTAAMHWRPSTTATDAQTDDHVTVGNYVPYDLAHKAHLTPPVLDAQRVLTRTKTPLHSEITNPSAGTTRNAQNCNTARTRRVSCRGQITTRTHH